MPFFKYWFSPPCYNLSYRKPPFIAIYLQCVWEQFFSSCLASLLKRRHAFNLYFGKNFATNTICNICDFDIQDQWPCKSLICERKVLNIWFLQISVLFTEMLRVILCTYQKHWPPAKTQKRNFNKWNLICQPGSSVKKQWNSKIISIFSFSEEF